jgi:DNA polymerase
VEVKYKFLFLQKHFIESNRNFYYPRSKFTLSNYLDSLKTCNLCPVRAEARQVVLPEYNYDSDILFVARNPGNQEDQVGRPLYPYAPGGKYFHKFLDIMKMKRDHVSVSNALFCHTRNDRQPTQFELISCARWKLFEFYFLPKVKYIVLMGNDAIRQFMGLEHVSIARSGVLGTFYKFNMFQNRKILIFPVYHPAYLLRNPSLSPEFYSLLDAISRLIDMDRKGNLKI